VLSQYLDELIMGSVDSGDVATAGRPIDGGARILRARVATHMPSVPATAGDATDYDVSMTGGLGTSVLLGQESLPTDWTMELPPVVQPGFV
jgi:hypothetical protein